MEKIYGAPDDDSEDTTEYSLIYGVTFLVILFVAQAIVVKVFGDFKSSLIWITLFVFSGVSAALLVYGDVKARFRKVSRLFHTLKRKSVLRAKKAKIRVKDIPEVKTLLASERGESTNGTVLGRRINELEERAKEKGALISSDGLSFVADFGGAAPHVLDKVIEKAATEVKTFDGWIVLNRDQVVSLLEGNGNKVAEKEEDLVEDTQVEESEFEAVRKEYQNADTSVPINLPTGKLQSEYDNAVISFLSYLAAGNEEEVFGFVRELESGSDGNVEEFIKYTVITLDRLHAHRLDGSGYVHHELLESTRHMTEDEIEEIISILIGAVDFRYKAPQMGVKIALLRVVEFLEKKMR